MSSFRSLGITLFWAAAGAAAFLLLYDRVAPAASVDLRRTRGEILEAAGDYLRHQGYHPDRLQQDAWFGFDGDMHLYLQSRGGVAHANRVIRADSLSTHNWYVTWYDRSVPPSQAEESFEAWFSPAGRPLGFQHTIHDTAARQSLTRDEALRRAEAFIARQGIRLAGYALKTSSETQRLNRLDHFFSWATADTSMESSLWVRILGGEVGGFRLENRPGESFRNGMSRMATTGTFLATLSYAVFFLTFFFVVILFLKKYHEGEVGTRTGIFIFAGLLAASILSTLNVYPLVGSGVGMGDVNRFNVRIIMLVFTIFVFHLFTSVMVFAAWSVGESSSRTLWPAKLSGMDSLLSMRFFTLDAAEGLTRGVLWGLILTGLYSAAVWMLTSATRVGVFLPSVGGVPESFLPPFRPFLAGITSAFLTELVYRLFFLSYLEEKTRRRWLSVALATAVWTLTAFALWELPFGYLRFGASFAAMACFGLAFAFLFLRYDLLTTMAASFTVAFLNGTIPLLSSSGSSAAGWLWVSGGLLVLPLAVSAGGLVKRRRFEFTSQTLPSHIQRISERVRMAKELEIARKVQMSLLPKANPSAEGFDIAGACIPALEVGGDYYDFVQLPDRRIGIAIGDVSGKGVPAAIYMTLTKGILQSHAEDNLSPRAVLSRVNSLMYRTIDRNSFVSMFYAILDPVRTSIRFARAGQCPLIMAQRPGREISFLTPRGMALGLEKGKVFDAVLEEQEAELQRGDVLLFYTDGFTEARNASGEEFGEERLLEALGRHRMRPAADILKGICEDVGAFTGGAPQHDDMTMVVVRVS
ncbi:MAG: PP2C family protein-serine/threonine phosphatase [Bacteroidota bacterium]